MQLSEITDGLERLLEQNHYNPVTIRFYRNEWKKIRLFLTERYGDTGFDMERGLEYLEEKYNFKTRYDEGTLSQQRVQLLRVIHMLEDYRLHRVLTRRYHASRNPISLRPDLEIIFSEYSRYLNGSELSKCTVDHYLSFSKVFLDFLCQRSLIGINNLTTKLCHEYLKTLAGYSFKTVEQNVCGLRHFLRFLNPESVKPINSKIPKCRLQAGKQSRKPHPHCT